MFAWGAPEYTFTRSQWIPGDPNEIFRYFSDPNNLPNLIDPGTLKLQIKKIEKTRYQAGTTIDYRLGLCGIPFGWTTLFAEWNPPHSFVDTSLRGPYILWHHLHTFEPKEGGVQMSDIVRYRIPFGIFGVVARHLFVKRMLEDIMKRREKRIERMRDEGMWR